MSDHGHQLRIVDDLWRQLSAIDAGHDRRARRTVARRRTLRTAVLIVLALLAAAALALAAGTLLFGSPAPNSPPLPRPGGRFVPGTVRLLSLRVPDPGGGPRWGLRVYATTGRLGCVQAGRVVNGRLVALGVDGSFGNDGRAHPLPVTTQNCGGLDAVGHLRVVGTPSISTASAATGGAACQTSDQTRIDRVGVTIARRHLRHPEPSDDAAKLRAFRTGLRAALHRLAHPRPSCPAADLRTVIVGGLGPAAQRMTLSRPSQRPIVEVLRPADGGGYLFVLSGRPVLATLRVSVRYRNGLECPVAQPFAPLVDSPAPPACRRIPPGYVYPPKRP